MRPRIDLSLTEGLRSGLTWLILVGIASPLATGAGEDPKPAAGTPAGGSLVPGAEVVLKSADYPLYDQGRAISGQDHLTFVVERNEQGRILVVSRDKIIRGWLHADQVVPLDQANDFFSMVANNDSGNADVYWMRGRLWFYQHDDERALANLNLAIRLEPDQARFYLSRSLVYLRTKRLDRAIEDGEMVIHLDPHSPQGYMVRANAWLAKKEYERASADLDQALRLDPTNPQARVVRVAYEKGGQNPARDQKATGRNPKGAAELMARGDDRLASKEYDQALDDYNEALRLDPSCAAAYAARGRAWAKKHYRDREVADLTESIKLEPNNPTYRVARAESWTAQGMHKPAMADYDDALRLEPENPAIWVSRGNEWRRHMKYDDAVADFTHAIQLNPKYIPAYIARGNTWKQRRLFAQAIQEFSALIRLDPENALAHQTLARILATSHEANYRNGKWAFDLATRACELTHWRDPDCLDTLAAACAETGDFAAAVKWQALAIELVRQNVPSLLQQKAENFGGQRGVGFEDRLAFYKSKKTVRE